MGLPTYLTASRHDVFYLRWPLPAALHPQGKAYDIKVSLRTRDRREALQLSRCLAYVGETLTSNAVASGMRYDEIRAVIKRHFKSLLDKQKDKIDRHGRLGAYDLSVLWSSLGIAETPVGLEIYDGQSEVRDNDVRRFLELYGLSLPQGSPAYEMLATELWRGYRDYVRAIRDYDQSFDEYAFDAGVSNNSNGSATDNEPMAATPLKEMATRYLEEGKLGNQWAAKTFGEKREQFELLYEIVGAHSDVKAVTTEVVPEIRTIG